MTGISLMDFTEFYMGGREQSTLSNYKSAFRMVTEQARELGTLVFHWGEGEMAGLVVKVTKDKRGENMMKKVSAVVNMLFEVVGLEPPTKGSSLRIVKMAAVKKMNLGKGRKKQKQVMTLADMSLLIRKIYLEGTRVSLLRRRFLALMIVLFFGVKRFSDVNKIKVKDVLFKKDGSVEVWMKSSKTDAMARGRIFKISGQRNGGITMGDILHWYVKSMRLRQDDYFFCKVGSQGKVVPREYLRYSEARLCLLREQERVGLKGLSLHSGRVGGDTEASEAGVTRGEIKEAGGWKSAAVDTYIQARGRGKVVSKALVKGLRL